MIKVKDRKILLLPGDGIGPEVIKEVRKIIEWFNKNKSLDFKIEEGLVGGASYEKYKKPITDEVFYKALESEAVILGAVGGPKYDNLEFSKNIETLLGEGVTVKSIIDTTRKRLNEDILSIKEGTPDKDIDSPPDIRAPLDEEQQNIVAGPSELNQSELFRSKLDHFDVLQ